MAHLDEHAKNILMHRPTLSRVIQRSLEETKDMTPEEVSACLVSPDDVKGSFLPSDMQKVGQTGKAFTASGHELDLLCAVRLPGKTTEIPIFIDVEPQAAHLSDIYERGIMYLCEMIVDQNRRYVNLKGDDANPTKDGSKGKKSSGYRGLLKCVVIWLLLDPPQYMRNTIKSISLQEADIFGRYHINKDRYDKMNMVIIGLSPERCDEDKTLDLLNVLFTNGLDLSSKTSILEEEYNYSVDESLRKELDDMIGLGQHMYDKGAFNQQLHDIKSNMAFYGVSLEKAMDGLNIKKEERDFYRRALFEENSDSQ